MRKLTATILVICLGILLPAAAIPVRICLLDLEERKDDCCNTCSSDNEDCCADLAPIPDAPVPNGNFETPPFIGFALPPSMVELPPIPERIVPPPCHARPPTGIGPPTARMAALNVWRL